MSDTPIGDGWWLASDGKYYPPEQHPDYVPPADVAPPMPPAADTGGWDAPQSPPPTGSQAAPEYTQPAATQGSSQSPILRFWWVPVLVGVVGLGAFFLFSGGDEDGDDVNAGDADPTPTVVETEPTAEPDPEATPEPEATTDPEGGATPTPLEQPTETPTEEPAATPAPTGPVDVTPGGFASRDAPAGFGQIYGTDEWRFTVVDAVDADALGLVEDFSDPVDEGFTNMAIIYSVTYTGDRLSEYDPIRLQAIGSETYDAFLGCYLDYDALAELGVQDFGAGELVPGQTSVLADCAVVRTDEVSDILVEVEYDFAEDPVYFSAAGGALPELNPTGIVAGPPDVATLALGETTTWELWSGAIVDIYDADEAGLINEFADPPEDGYVFLAVEYDITNIADDGEFDPIVISALGEMLYSSFSGCFLDFEAAEEAGLLDPFDDVPVGETKRSAVCIAMPSNQVDDVVFRFENYSEFEDPGLYRAN